MSIPLLENLFIYPTWACNLNCEHCWVNEKEANGCLSRDMLDKAISEALDLGLTYIKISGGEPLIAGEITEFIINKVKYENVNVSIETNGTLIDERWAKIFSENEVSVSVSIDSHEESTHDRFRGLVGSFEKTINAVELLVKNDVQVGIVTSISNINYDTIEKMIELAKNLNVSFLKFNPIVKVGNAKKINQDNDFIFTLYPEEMLELRNKYCNKKSVGIPVDLFLPMGLSNIKNILSSSPPIQNYSCINCPTLNLISILPNGDLGLCPEANRSELLKFDNLYNTNLRKVWIENYNLYMLRSEIPDKLSGVCGKCMIKNICKGSCRAVAVSNSGTINAPHPICQYLFDKNKFHLAYVGSE